jgi:hypothetical protein
MIAVLPQTSALEVEVVFKALPPLPEITYDSNSNLLVTFLSTEGGRVGFSLSKASRASLAARSKEIWPSDGTTPWYWMLDVPLCSRPAAYGSECGRRLIHRPDPGPWDRVVMTHRNENLTSLQS